jgi:hypothetical protein
MMSLALYFVLSPKKFNVHLCQKCLLSSPVLSLGCASARKPRLEQKDALFGLDRQITKYYTEGSKSLSIKWTMTVKTNVVGLQHIWRVFKRKLKICFISLPVSLIFFLWWNNK